MSELHTFELRQREGSEGIMTGANTELLMDGVKMAGVTEVNIHVKAAGIAEITLKVFGKFKAKGDMKWPECSCYAEADCGGNHG